MTTELSPPIDTSVGLSNPQLNDGRRRMLDLVNRLHSTGVQVDVDLPQIAVIGSQSAGKSSLIEAISGITLPRAAGTCTRCPTECRLSRNTSSPWQCTVSLRFTVDAKGQPLGQAKNQPFGDVIYDKSKVEERIRRAQLAILNPRTPYKKFLDGEVVDAVEPALTFSMNCVTLQISGKDVADLSFCDLPGLIASVSGNRADGTNDIALVESLVTAYIKKPSCIILLTVACETDFENQGAHRLAKEHDPHGKRTIGVLTKPDRIPIGEEYNWLPFIRNEKETLENNWYAVKQPSSNDLKSNITWAQARQMEDDFFASKAPWSELEGVYQKYLRTSNLVERLSSILSDLIAKRLPKIQKELEQSIMTTRDHLSQLPRKPSSDPRSEISELLHKFTTDLSRHVQGVSINIDPTSRETSSSGLIQSIRPIQESFRRTIRLTAPNFRPFERNDSKRKHLFKAAFLTAEEGAEFDGEASDSEDEGEDEGEIGTEGPGIVAAPSTSNPRKRKEAPTLDTRIYIDEVLERAQQARTRELPGSVPFAVQKSFIEEFMKEWRAPAFSLCQSVHRTVSKHVDGVIKKHFAHFGQGQLEHRVRYSMQQHMKSCLDCAQERVDWLLQVEATPFSLNTHYLSDYRSKFFAHYKAAREKYHRGGLVDAIEEYSGAPSRSIETSGAQGPGPDVSASIAKILSGLAEIGMTGVKPEDLAKLLPPDQKEPALGIMADVRAYFQVAYKRVTDIIPLIIDYELVQSLDRNLLPLLYKDLGINSPDGATICAELAKESPMLSGRRADYERKLERLESASGELMALFEVIL